MISKDDEVCYLPFYMAEISDNGNVYPCCPRFVDFYSIGNLFENDFQEIWFSEKANNFREMLLNSNYSLCNRNICTGFSPQKKEQVLYEFKKNSSCKFLRLAYNNVCNIACRTCRDELKLHDTDKQKYITKKIMPLLENIEKIQMSTAGDVFASKDGIELLKYVINNYPNISLMIDTNGILLTPKLYETLKLRGRIQDLQISIPGATKKTYEKIVCKGNFDAVMRNLKFISQEKEKGNIHSVYINMVISKYNYKEMIKMAKIVKKLNLSVRFTCYQPWEHTTLAKKYEELAVFEPNNPLYKSFLKQLKKKELLFDCCSFEPRINPTLIFENQKENSFIDFLKAFLMKNKS